jgi:hypothetical protein
VDSLLFPVKHLRGLLWTMLLVSCGYQSAYDGETSSLSVVLAPSPIAQAEAAQGGLEGARGELARAGALRGGAGFPRLMLEIVRVDERSAGIRAVAGAQRVEPRASGSVVVVVGRAWIETRAEAPRQRATGDMTRSLTYASGSNAFQERGRHAGSVHAAGRELGAALTKSVLGIPQPAHGPEPFN